MWHVMSVTKHRRCSEVVLIAKKGYILCQHRTCPKSCVKIAQNNGACAAPTPWQCNIPTLWCWALGGGACLSIMDHFGLPTVLSLLVKLNYCFFVLKQHAAQYYSDCHTSTRFSLQITNIEIRVQETHIQLLRVWNWRTDHRGPRHLWRHNCKTKVIILGYKSKGVMLIWSVLNGELWHVLKVACWHPA